MKWVELNSPQLGSVSRETICVLPLGATEQHGPHLPLATDQIIADGLAERLDDACGGKLLVLPGLPATCSEHHMAFPGSLTLDHDTFARVVGQLIHSAARHGFRRFFLLNAHGGNMAIGGVIAEQLSTSLPDAEVVFGTWFRMAGEKLRHLVEGAYPAVGHACEFETSLLLAMRPELVDRAAIVDDGVAPTSPLLRFDLLSGGPTVRSVAFDKFTTNGVWGKPSKATAEKGHAILAITIPLIKELLAAHWPAAPGLDRDLSNAPAANGAPSPLSRRAHA
ncbi:MAG: creatininase family protein [Pirellulales bacterium]|nr:creatininase family protein [Pirellulales bacterium]